MRGQIWEAVGSPCCRRLGAQRGALLFLNLLLCIGLSLLTLSLSRLWRERARQQRAQTAVDVVALSSARVAAETLQRVAERWETDLGRYTGGVNGETVFVAHADHETVRLNGQKLAASLGGYRGRATAVIRVVADANGVDRDEIELLQTDAAQFNVAAPSFVARDEDGADRVIVGGWLQRLFEGPQALRHRYRGADSYWEVRWDVNSDHPRIREGGNGGFPRTWEQAVFNGRLDPHRVALYRAQWGRP